MYMKRILTSFCTTSSLNLISFHPFLFFRIKRIHTLFLESTWSFLYGQGQNCITLHCITITLCIGISSLPCPLILDGNAFWRKVERVKILTLAVLYPAPTRRDAIE